MSALLIVGTAWAALSAPLALLIGRSIRLADRTEQSLHPRVPDFVPEVWTEQASGPL